jgi:hypothetical protein
MTFGSVSSRLPLVEQRAWADVTARNASRVYLVDGCLKLATTGLRSRRVRMYKFFVVDTNVTGCE